jgi:hypothetical protein
MVGEVVKSSLLENPEKPRKKKKKKKKKEKYKKHKNIPYPICATIYAHLMALLRTTDIFEK